MDQITTVTIALISSMSVLILTSAGLAVVYGFMGIVNFSQGAFIMLGAYVLLVVDTLGAPLLVAVLIAAVVTGLLGAVVYSVLIRPLKHRALESILVTWGFGIILTQIIIIVFGPVSSNVSAPLGSFQIGDYSTSWYSVVVIGAAALMMLASYVLFTRTRFGLRANASIQVPEMALALGIRTERVKATTFGIGCALAGAAGAIVAPLYSITPQLGDIFIANSFLTVAVGGPLPVTGLLAAGSVLGIAQGITATAFSILIGQVTLLVTAIILLRIFGRGFSANWRKRV
ncbi:branched-chain amino acid ABC transporter permease [Cryobacterium sp. TMS1-20-1]|uniref:branched-chain amino acid ABC transporter permease n=1 Tax=Cryobacterium sp. TMS1-20-1 TaxID=1259223 RepID=UPI00106DC121|nr:branched-chain amino acid ABC transporter permease [Cryobacterium sp. TMS1-20-1]TFC74103.1 branched-chain amino acid ABC transporter permease [Cryobacterium sp. TMS1-20-1]